MLIDTSSYCKRCGETPVDGGLGNLWNETHELYEENICAGCAIKLLDGKNATGITLNRSLIPELVLKAGKSTSKGCSWRPSEAKFSVESAIAKKVT
jgi:hypothetical protein